VKLHRISSFLKRRINQFLGAGPWRSAPFCEIASCRLDTHVRGVHRAEDFTGIVVREDEPPFAYHAGHPLFGQVKSFELLEDGRRYRDSGLICPFPKILLSLCDAGVAADDGVVYCPRTRRAVRETLRSWTEPGETHRLLGALRLPGATPLPGLTLNLCTLSGSGYYHFLVESLPKLWLGRGLLSQVDHFLANGSASGLYGRWLERAGVPMNKVIWQEPLSHYRCEQLLFSGPLMSDQGITPWGVDAIRSLLDPPKPKNPHRRIWVSRRDAKLRRIKWEDELLARLDGFERVELANLDPANQIQILAEARVVAGPHGAGFSGLPFCQPGGCAIEIFPPNCMMPIYQRIAQASGLGYYWAQLDFEGAPDIGRLANAIIAAADSTGQAEP